MKCQSLFKRHVQVKTTRGSSATPAFLLRQRKSPRPRRFSTREGRVGYRPTNLAPRGGRCPTAAGQKGADKPRAAIGAIDLLPETFCRARRALRGRGLTEPTRWPRRTRIRLLGWKYTKHLPLPTMNRGNCSAQRGRRPPLPGQYQGTEGSGGIRADVPDNGKRKETNAEFGIHSFPARHDTRGIIPKPLLYFAAARTR